MVSRHQKSQIGALVLSGWHFAQLYKKTFSTLEQKYGRCKLLGQFKRLATENARDIDGNGSQTGNGDNNSNDYCRCLIATA